MSYVYILKSAANKYYIGATNNVENRLKQHNLGKVKSTKSGRPWHLIHIEKYNTISESRKREVQIKGWKSRKAIERLLAASSSG